MSQQLLSLFEKLLYFFLHLVCIRLKIKELVTVTCLVPPEAQGTSEGRGMSSITQEENKAGGTGEGQLM